MEPPWVNSATTNKKKKGHKMRIHKLTPIILSLVVLGAITAALVRYRTVEAQQDRAVQTQITPSPQITATPLPQQTPGGGVNPVPGPETTRDSDVDLVLDADEVEKRALEEKASDTTTAAVALNPIPVSFKHVALPIRGGLDHAVAGVGTRNSGEGVIRLRGVPPGSQLLSALLVWGEIAPAAVAPYNVAFGPDCGVMANVVGSHLPFPTNPAPEPFWFAGGSFFAYIANVTPQIAPGINGDYRIKGLRSAIRDGRCPWGDGACAAPPLNLTLSEGASLILIYANQCIPRQAQLFFNLGPSTFFGINDIFNHLTFIPIAALPNLKHSRIGGDGQVGNANCGLRSIPGASDERTFIEGLGGFPSTQIKGDGGGLDRDSDWNGDDGQPLNKLWDTHTDVFTNNLAGQIGYRVRYQTNGDGIVWVVHILGVR
jgi:hypothetical protein